MKRSDGARALIVVWVLPYVALAIARYGFSQADLQGPSAWIPALAGIQLFASVALVADMRLARALAVVAALMYIAYFAGLLPGGKPPSSVLPQLCISSLMAIALWLPLASGQLSLAQAGFMATGAYGSAWLTVAQQWAFFPALMAGAFGTMLFGLVVSYPALRLRGVYLAIATLGLGEVIRIFFLNLEATGGAFGFSGIARHTQPWHLGLALGLLCVALFMLMRGRIGRAIWAVRHDEIAATALGINVTRVRILTFTLGAFVAGLAGGLQAHYLRFIAPDNYGLSALIEWLVFVMLGGHEVFVGAIAGTVVLGTLPDLMRFLSEWRLLLNGVLLIVLLALRPTGIVTRELLGWRLSPRVRRGDEARSEPPKRAASSVESSSPASGDLLRIEAVSKSFGGLSALVGVSFAVRGRHIHGLIGPNGAGKTTLFNAIAGLERIDAGRIVFAGGRIERLRPDQIVSRGIARTFQNIRLYGDLSVLENSMLGAYTRAQSGVLRCAVGLDRAEERATAARSLFLLHLLGLAERADDPAASLSYGDQRRLEMARALASDAQLLVLDEPAAGMNEHEAVALGGLLARLRDEFGKTVLLIEHDLDLVMRTCQELTVLNFGHVIANGTPAEVRVNEGVIAAYLGTFPSSSADLAA